MQNYLARFYFSRNSWPFWLTACAIVVWSASAAVINPAQYADNLEQFTWSHSFEMGYWKHPPLPTWIIAAFIRIVGFSVYWTYALAAFSFVGTAFFTWKIAQRLFGGQTAMFAVLLFGLHMGFSWRAQLYNHNTVLVLLSAATVWATLLALETRRLLSWVWVGVLAGLAMLSKYQAVLPLMGILIALHGGGFFKQKNVMRGVVVAGIVAWLVFIPHLLWIAASSGSTIDNALHSAEGLGFVPRIVKFLTFWIVQIRFHTPILAAVAFLVLLKSKGSGLTDEQVVQRSAGTLSQQQQAWFLGLVVWPIAFVSMLVLLGGMRLEAQWGLQTFQFLAIFIAWKLAVVLPRNSMNRTLWVVLATQLVLGVFFAWSVIQPSQTMWRGSRTRNFPAQSVAKEVFAHWQQATTRPLRFVVGPSMEAAIVSAYSGQYPEVLEDGDFHKSPWVAPEKLKTEGAVYLSYEASELPEKAIIRGQLVLPARKNDFQPQRQLFWGLVLPSAICVKSVS